MAWDVGYMGNCPTCGEHIHHFHEDRPGYSAMWLRCPPCQRADLEQISNEALDAFRDEPHPCAVCGTERERWDESRCPRCGRRDVGEFIYMPD